MAFFKTLKIILDHPLTKHHKLRTLGRYARWQLFFRLHPHPVIHPYVGETSLVTYKGLTGAVFSIYVGLEEFEDMAFMLHMLRPVDTFADIGANIRSYSVLAAGVTGCHTITVEPVPSTFSLLKKNIYVNEIDHLLTLHNVGVGSENGVIRFTNSLDTINHVATAGDTHAIEVPVRRLDELVSETPTLMKIHVEGFEQEVLKGSQQTLQDTSLQAIIIELNGSGKRYGYKDEDIHQQLLSLGFKPFVYKPFERRLEPLQSYGVHNTIYIRDIDFVQQRITTADQIEVLNQLI